MDSRKLNTIRKISDSHFLQPNEKCVLISLVLECKSSKKCTIRLSELSVKTRFNPITLWKLITSLVKKNYVKRFVSVNDKRIKTYEILI